MQNDYVARETHNTFCFVCQNKVVILKERNSQNLLNVNVYATIFLILTYKAGFSNQTIVGNNK